MSGSREFSDLVSHIADVENGFLPVVDPLEEYDLEIHRRTSAYLLLVHAMIEEFIEQRCLAVVNQVVQNWEGDRRLRTTLLSLICYTHDSSKGKLYGKGSSEPLPIREIIAAAKASYSQVVNNNNGVKRNQLYRLVLPAGVRLDQLPAGFVEDMDTFGSKRGREAHQAVGTRQMADPAESKALVSRIVSGLGVLDRHLQGLEMQSGCVPE